MLSGAARIWPKIAIALALPVCGIGDIQTTSQTLLANIAPNGKLSVPASVTLRSANSHFGAMSGDLTVSFWARTSEGGGSITVQSSDFSPAGGPAAGAVSFTCSGATLGTGCSGIQALATATQTSLVALPGGACTGGGGVCTNQEPNSVTLSFSVPSQPHYKTGTYSAQLTFTISTI